MTISIGRPANPPAALTLSTSIMMPLRDEVPSCATRPDRMVGIPTLMVLACAPATQGVANVTAVPPISASAERRLMPDLRDFVIIPSLVGFASSQSLAGICCPHGIRISEKTG